MTLFDRVKKVSKDRGFSLAEVARKSGIGEKSIYTWKPSKTYPQGVTPSHEILESVAKTLDVSVDFLLESDKHLDKSPENKRVKRLSRRMENYDDDDLTFIEDLFDTIEKRKKNGQEKDS